MQITLSSCRTTRLEASFCYADGLPGAACYLKVHYLRIHFLLKESARERNLLGLVLAANILQNLSLQSDGTLRTNNIELN